MQLIEANSQSNLPEVNETWCIKQILDIHEIQDFQEKHVQELMQLGLLFTQSKGTVEMAVKCKMQCSS